MEGILIKKKRFGCYLRSMKLPDPNYNGIRCYTENKLSSFIAERGRYICGPIRSFVSWIVFFERDIYCHIIAIYCKYENHLGYSGLLWYEPDLCIIKGCLQFYQSIYIFMFRYKSVLTLIICLHYVQKILCVSVQWDEQDD